MKHWPKIYYVSQGDSPEDHLENIELVCKAGCKLVQLRLKEYSEEKVLETAQKANAICEFYQSKLFINDFINVIPRLSSIGLHIGKNDTPMTQAKKRLEYTPIGGTANTLEDCLNLVNMEADYIGLGPFKNTNTKKNLDPVLGFDGYKEIITKLKSLKINLPIYAIGGITDKDIESLLNIGLTGVAVSGLLTHKSELELKEIINKYE